MKKNTPPKSPKVGLSFTLEAGLGLPIVRTSGFSRKGNRYIPYSSASVRVANSNNLPQVLAKIALESPTHGAAIQRKSLMIEGLGIDNTLLSNSLVKKLENNLNEQGETMNDLHSKISKDYALFNEYAIS